MSTTSGICVIGTGWGRYLSRELRSIYSDLMLVCGRDGNRAKQVAGAVGADGSITGWEQAVRDDRVRAVVIALPHHMHAKVANAALENGKHVFLEKPIAVNSFQAEEMISAARRNALVFSVGENVPFRPDLRITQSMLSEIGPITSVHATCCHRVRPNAWRQRLEEMGGGVLIDQGVHYVRAIRMLAGEPDRVYAVVAEQTINEMGGEDNAFVVLSGGGWQATIRIIWSSEGGTYPEYLVIGKRGSITLQSDGSLVTVYPTKNRYEGIISRVRPYFLQQLLSKPEWYARRIPISKDSLGYRAQMEDFLRRINQHASWPDVESAEAAKRDLEIAEAGYRSIRRQVAVPVGAMQEPKAEFPLYTGALGD